MDVSISLKLLTTKNPIISVSSIFCIILLSLVIDVKSSSDYSFNFTTFTKRSLGHISLANDASIANEVLELTKKTQSGYPLPTSVGQATLHKPIQLYNKTSGKVIDFTTEFTFVVIRHGRVDRGDGMTFFLASPRFEFPDKIKSAGGFLGMFTNDNAFDNDTKDQIVLVEFDSFDNDWDPYYPLMTQKSHLGINVNSVKSMVTGPWFIDSNPDGTKGIARISYDSKAKKLSVSVSYPNEIPPKNSSLVQDIDLTTVLPERVFMGFSAATGELVETHDILSWFFTSNM